MLDFVRIELPQISLTHLIRKRLLNTTARYGCFLGKFDLGSEISEQRLAGASSASTTTDSFTTSTGVLFRNASGLDLCPPLRPAETEGSESERAAVLVDIGSPIESGGTDLR